jgi:hypothetical protein
MKRRIVKVQLQEKIDFLNRHDRLAIQACEDAITEKEKELVRLARGELIYSDKTGFGDILASLVRANKIRMSR